LLLALGDFGRFRSMSHPADDVRRQHEPAVLANQVELSSRWGQLCRAYHVCVRPGPAAAAALAALQARVLQMEPALLAVPEHALHANLISLLPVTREFDRPKDELWQRRAPEWIATLADAASRTSGFGLTFRRLAATNAAIIAVADQPNRLSALRRELTPLLQLPSRAGSGDLAHVTLFRYAAPLRDSASLLRWVAETEFHVDVNVSELLVVKERVYPRLDYEVVHRLPLS
jgi:hypothetical protein